MFQVGDRILYGNTGVCTVVDIVDRCGAGDGGMQPHYVLKPLYQDCTISTPAESPKVFMRAVISREKAEKLIDRIPTYKGEAFHSPAMRQLTEHYEASLKTHDCADLFELTLSIHAKRKAVELQNRKLGAIDEKYMKRAEELLFGELAVALDMPKEHVSGYIAARMDECRVSP